MLLEASVLAVATKAFAWSEAQQKRLCCRAARKESKIGIAQFVAGPPTLHPGGAAAVRVMWCVRLYKCVFPA